MKISRKMIVIVSVAFALSMFAGCASSKQDAVPVASDTYVDSTDETVSETTEQASEKSEAKTKKKKEGFSITKTISNLFASKFYEFDETTLFASGTFGGIKQQTAAIVYYPKADTVGFGSPIMAAYYYLTFDEPSRQKIADAVTKYLSDFENKKLDRKAKKSFKSYGNVKSKLFWGTIKSSTPNTGEGTINLGYMFEKNSPYFTLSMFPIKNDLYTGPDCGYVESSITLHFYFTKAQAQALVDCLTSEKVSIAIQEYNGAFVEIDEYNADNYYDSDDADDVAEAEEIDVSDAK